MVEGAVAVEEPVFQANANQPEVHFIYRNLYSILNFNISSRIAHLLLAFVGETVFVEGEVGQHRILEVLYECEFHPYSELRA